MKISLEADLENDHLYVALSDRALEAGAVERTMRVNDDVWPDFDAEGDCSASTY
jgi:uncharacterized protein YuzE